MRRMVGSGVLTLALTPACLGQSDFVNWETPHVNPIDMTPDGSMLLAVNTADNRLEVFELSSGTPVAVGAVPVGLDPVSVRARTSTEAWVVNHISDSVSIVDLSTLSLIATLPAGDEPADVVFAGSPQRAFVSVSQMNHIKVFDPANLAAAPVIVPIEGEDPRALATDGSTVYAAVFESGNDTTIIAQSVVSSAVNPYPGDANPPPNDGTTFSPAMNPSNPAPPAVSLIVRKDAFGAWRDDNGTDWSAAVPWDLHGHDVAAIDADALTASYVGGLMNINMNLSVNPAGDVFVVGTDAINDVRFEPNVNGIFVRVVGAKIASGGGAMTADLNPHLDYLSPTVDQDTRDLSLGDPRGIDWSASRGRAYIAGMGSNNLVAVDGSLSRLGLAEVGQGPTGVQVDEGRGVAYVLNKFEGSISVVDLDSLDELERIAFFDPTPPVIKAGRPRLYDTHATSGLGQASCASCHVDGRMDQLAWDLGDPAGAVKPFNQTCQLPAGCQDWHPMKGPMATQTLIGILGTGPLHWRADRENVGAFNGAFTSLMGDDEQLTPAEMNQFINLVGTFMTPPNPNRNLDNTLRASLPNGGNPQVGEVLYMTGGLDGVECNTCHLRPTGTNGTLTPAALLQETQDLKVPQLRNMFEKTGFDQASLSNNRGFGFIHDGSVDTLFSFLLFPGFQFAAGETGNQQRRDVAAFLMSFDTDTHAGVGAQATVGGATDDRPRRDLLRTIADAGQVGLVAKSLVSGVPRGFTYVGGGTFQSDLAAETWTIGELDAAVDDDGAVITYTLVPLGSETRIGIDRDRDGHFDRDEYFACSDAADPVSVPGGNPCPPDTNGDLVVDINDLLTLLAEWGQSRTAGDVNCDGAVNIDDLLEQLAAWGPCL